MIKLVKRVEDASYITHNGTLHADEVFATAFLDFLFKDIKLIRVASIDSKLYSDKIIYDIGLGKYDHHQVDAKVRDNGIKYSSFGLLWQEFGKEYLKQEKVEDIDEVFDAMDKELIEGIDAIDNGIFPEINAKYKVKTLSDVIKLFNPSIFTDEDYDKQFLKAVEFAKTIFQETLYNVEGKIKSKRVINKLINENDDKFYLELDRYMPYEDAITSNEKALNILFVIYPSNRGGYAIKTIPKSKEEKTDRLLLPEKWAGLQNEELEHVTKIKGATFCHYNRFIATAKTRDAILLIAKEALK